MLEVCTDKHRLIFPIQCDRRMQALQILNTLCTLLLEKMNTFLLTCLYLSFTLFTLIWSSEPPRPPLRGPPKTHFSIFIAFSFYSPTQLWCLCSDSTNYGWAWFSESLSYTLCMDSLSPCCSALSRHRSNRTTDPSTGDLQKVQSERDIHCVSNSYVLHTCLMYGNQIRPRNLGNNLRMKK